MNEKLHSFAFLKKTIIFNTENPICSKNAGLFMW